MNHKAAVLGGIGLGIGLMYLLDPAMGRRRRALVRDKGVRYWHKTRDALGTASRDLSNRARGVTAEIGSVSTDEQVEDSVLEARVRSRMGRVVSHPSAISVSAGAGRVALSGDVLRSESDTLLRAVSKVSGVRSVENNLQVHETAENVPALQGPPRPTRSRFNPGTWSPSTKLFAGAAGTALAVYGITKAAVPRPQPRWRRMLSAAGLALARIPGGISHIPRGMSYIPRGVSYVPKGISYIPRGLSYLPRYDFDLRSWSPATRVIAAGTGAALMAYSIARVRNRRRNVSGWRRVLYEVSNLRQRVPAVPSRWRNMPSRVAQSMPWVH